MSRIWREIGPVLAQNIFAISMSYSVAGALGFEPRITGPKPVALPLGHAPIRSSLGKPPSIYVRTRGRQMLPIDMVSGCLLPASRSLSNARQEPLPLLSCRVLAGRLYTRLFSQRSVAQPGSAPASGAGGREFKSPHSDHLVDCFVDGFVPQTQQWKGNRLTVGRR
jgi:hypothetical protein